METPNSVVPETFSKFGNQDAKNNVQVLPGIPTTIFRIRTDSEVTFYMLSQIIRYGRYDVNGFVPSGEFRYKWDDSAQWFGVEKVVY